MRLKTNNNQETIMKFKSWKRVFSGILAAVTVISSCTAGPVMAASEETETGYPTLQEVIDQLDEDEIVRPSDYIVPVGSDLISRSIFQISTCRTGRK